GRGEARSRDDGARRHGEELRDGVARFTREPLGRVEYELDLGEADPLRRRAKELVTFPGDRERIQAATIEEAKIGAARRHPEVRDGVEEKIEAGRQRYANGSATQRSPAHVHDVEAVAPRLEHLRNSLGRVL